MRILGLILMIFLVGLWGYENDKKEELAAKAAALETRVDEHATREVSIKYKEVNEYRYKYQDAIEQIEELKKELDANIETSLELGDNVNTATFEISAYSPYDDRNGINSEGDPSVTASGAETRPGTFAVDPSVIPYGSDVVIIYKDGTVERGRAEDTGGAIKGNRIDVFRWSYDTAMDFGMNDATVLWY